MMLEVENVYCSRGASQILHGVSLKVDEGEVVSLLGRNGAGKTTTIESIVGLVPPSSGLVRVSATRLNGRRPYEISRSGVGWVPQGRRVFQELTVEDNIRLACLKLPSRMRLEAFQRVYSLFPILRERAATRAGVLSGGEQQMLAIARALVGTPRVLLLDEPTEGLSPSMCQTLMRTIKMIAAQGVAILLAEQNVRVALATGCRHYVLDKGEVRVAMTTAEIQSRNDLLVAFLGVAARASGSDGVKTSASH
jgi:branched-chain amino acid transport system ATP-binding protein